MNEISVQVSVLFQVFKFTFRSHTVLVPFFYYLINAEKEENAKAGETVLGHNVIFLLLFGI